MNYSIEELFNLYLDLLKCFENQTPAFELVRLIDEFFKARDMKKIILPRNTKFNRTYDIPALFSIKKQAIKLGENPLGSYDKKTSDLIKQKIEVAITNLNEKYGIIEFDTKQEDYLEYLKNREFTPITFICSFCGVDVEIVQKSNMISEKIYCPYCSKENNLS